MAGYGYFQTPVRSHDSDQPISQAFSIRTSKQESSSESLAVIGVIQRFCFQFTFHVNLGPVESEQMADGNEDIQEEAAGQKTPILAAFGQGHADHLKKLMEDLRAENTSESSETLTRMFELLESQRIVQQALLSKLTSEAKDSQEAATKADIWAKMFQRDLEGLRPVLEKAPSSLLVAIRDDEGMTLVHHMTRLGLGPALQYVLDRVPGLADAVSHPSGRVGNWTALMVLVDTPPGSIGGNDYAYNMLRILLRTMSATGIMQLAIEGFASTN